MQMGLTSSTGSLSSRTSASSYGQSVYEMAALTTDLDTQNITTKIKETLMAHNIGQKVMCLINSPSLFLFLALHSSFFVLCARFYTFKSLFSLNGLCVQQLPAVQ